MLGVGNLYLCALSVSFTINSGLSGEKPFEELHFKQSVFIASILLSLRCYDGEAWQNMAFKINFRPK